MAHKDFSLITFLALRLRSTFICVSGNEVRPQKKFASYLKTQGHTFGQIKFRQKNNNRSY